MATTLPLLAAQVQQTSQAVFSTRTVQLMTQTSELGRCRPAGSADAWGAAGGGYVT
jgi:hypothetical protein